ncbi:hypothetical protein ACO2Q0_10960 [Phenylobacterium sp. VNQ135]|uniref:hypothetical protein n=1 Tax=Phenylobacterium sp. VNQ135 TaxID=3400922 RepID=UPI003C0FBA0B
MAHAFVVPSGRTLAIALSAAAHAGLFLLFAWRLGETPERPEPPVMIVELTPLPKRAPQAARTAPRREEPAERDRRQVTARPSLPPPTGIAPPTPAPFETRDDPGGQVLRGLMDCRPANLDRLSPEARERCERRLAGDPALKSASGPGLNLDPSGRYVQEEQPYLARRPKKGCKARAGATRDPMGKQGPATGIACAMPF